MAADLLRVFEHPLRSYVDDVRHLEPKDRRPKVINDAIWKTVRVEAWEVVVLDSPPVQRLRNVHQLGLAGLVYPGAGYSRFEHSVGVLYQTQRVIDSINHNARASGRTISPISAADEALLRLAGLLHDIGHGFLSHVSERAMSRIANLPHGGSAADARREARKYFKCRKTPSFSEVLASLLVMLPPFTELLALAQVPNWSDADNLATHIAHLIVGSTPYRARPFLSEIISGSVDADKLDYMARDCFFAGLPMPVDVERLLQKMQAVAISGDTEPGRSWAEFSGLPSNQPIYVMAIDERGGVAAEELVVSRVLLYHKLYHHQKIRAFEGLAELALDLLIEGVPKFRSPGTYLSLTDSDFLERRWDIDEGNSEYGERAEALVRMIHARYETVRAIAFGPSMIEQPATDLQIAWAKLRPFVSRERTPESAAFKTRVVERAREFLSLAGQDILADRLSDDSIIVDLPDPQGISEKTRFLVGNEQTGLRHYSDVARVDRWSEAYEADKSIGYVYSRPQHAVAVHLAVRSIIFDIAEIELEDRQLTLTKISPDDVIRFAEIVRSRGGNVREISRPTGWMNVVPIAVRSEIESKYGIVITELAQKFHSYQPYEGPAVDAALIVSWLTQFSSQDIPLALTVLQNIQFWTRQRISDAFRSFFESIAPTHSIVQLVPLGGPTTSAEHLQYLIDDFKNELPLEAQVLGSLEAVQPGIPLIFIDDYIGSGGQSCTVFEQWYGLPEEEWTLPERHVEPLSETALDRLTKCEVWCVFAAGRRAGLRNLLARIASLSGVRAKGWIVQPRDLGCFRLAANVFERPEDATRAQLIFEDAGYRALLGEAWDEQKRSTRLLGYGNNADLNVFFYNTPASTLTALWKKSTREDAPWLPLFARRKRQI